MTDHIPARDGAHASDFDGRAGLLHLQHFADFTAQDPAAFRSTFTRVQFDHVWIETFRATAHRCRRQPTGSSATDAVAATYVVDGNAQVRERGAEYTLAKGDVALTRSTEPFDYVTDGPIALVRSVVGAIHFPPRMIDSDLLPTGPIAATRLVTSFAAFISQLASAPPTPTRAHTDYLVRGLVDLQTAVIVGATATTADPNRTDRMQMRLRMIAYIDQHLSDQGLGPQMIADDLCISVRSVYRVFNAGEVSLARYIRDQRLEAVATALQDDPPRSKAELAARFGFTGRDQLTRWFKQRFDTTIDDYRAAHR